MRSELAYRGLSQHVQLDRAVDPRDRFTLHELIGEGTYGEVYCARDNKFGRRVAVKVFTVLWSNSLSFYQLRTLHILFCVLSRFCNINTTLYETVLALRIYTYGNRS